MTTDPDPRPPVLSYAAAAAPSGAAARIPVWVIVLVSVCLPGVGSWVTRGRRGAITFLGLWASVVAAYLFFGPFWGEVLFAHSPLKEAGLYPFLGTCAAVVALSPALAIRDRNKALEPYDGQVQ